MREGKFAEAKATLENAAQESPANPQVCLALTQLYSRTNDASHRDEHARHCVELAQASDRWSERANIRDYLGKIYLATGGFDDAVREYGEAVRLSPYEEQYRFDLAQAFLGRERFREAVDVLRDAEKSFDKSPQIQLALGVAYYGERRFPDAVNAFLRTIELAPDVLQPYVFLGKMLDQAGDRMPEIARRFEALRENRPDDYVPYLLLAKMRGAQGGDAAEREKLLRRSILLNDHNAEAHYELGVLLETVRDYAGAAGELQKSAQLLPDDAATHYHLARVYDRLKQPDAAAQEREKHRALTAHEKITAGMER